MPKSAQPLAVRKPMSVSLGVEEIIALANEGHWSQLEVRARALATRQPGQALGWKALGNALLHQGKFDGTVSALTRLVRIVPFDVFGHHNLAIALEALGRHSEAEASYRRALKANPKHAASHHGLGTLLSRQGRLDEALAQQRLGLEAEPKRAPAHLAVAHVLRELGRLREAEASYRHALDQEADCFEAHLFLGLTLADLAQFDDAIAHHRRAVVLRPDSHAAQLRLGSLLSLLRREEREARCCLERCLELEPDNSDGYIALGNELLRTNEIGLADRMFETAQDLRPLLPKPSLRAVPDFTVLMLDTAGAGCTPVDYLSGRSLYARNFYCVIPRRSPHVELLRTSGAVVFNMIGDADNGATVLPYAVELADSLGLPVVNHPRHVQATCRDAMAARLAGTAGARIPKTLRLAAGALADACAQGVPGGLSLPVLVRQAGTHGGDVFERFDDLGAMAAFASRQSGVDLYLTEYVDYRSADGFFRKYRFICIDGELLPYHLAIHGDWMVHHFRTDMANQPWMQREEEAFLARPHEVFDERRHAAVLAMARACGLDYCGVDVGIDANGHVVFFEANATMLVHDEKDGPFVFKNPFIARIKLAFDDMLARRAGRSG